jgi:hypothetical protein
MALLDSYLRAPPLDFGMTAGTGAALSSLQHDLRLVPAVLGATVTFCYDASAVGAVRINLVATTIEPTEIAAALRLPLKVLRPSWSGSIVLYAGVAGAFAAMAAALVDALSLEPRSLDQNPRLPQSAISPGVTGLEAFATVNRALGLLVAGGRTVEQAWTEMRHRAARSDLPTAAQVVLDTLVPSGPPAPEA